MCKYDQQHQDSQTPIGALESHSDDQFDQMAKKASAFKEYREAAMMLKVLPQKAAEISGPISQAYTITMIICGDGAIGAGADRLEKYLEGFSQSGTLSLVQIHQDTML